MQSPTLTRRAVLAGAGVVVSSAAIGTAIVPAISADEVCSLPVDPVARYHRAVAELKAASLALRPDLDVWKIARSDMGVLVWGYSSTEAAKPLSVEYSGFGVYEIDLGATRPTVALMLAESGAGYHWQLCHRRVGGEGYRFQGDVQFAQTPQIIIKRKIAALA